MTNQSDSVFYENYVKDNPKPRVFIVPYEMGYVVKIKKWFSKKEKSRLEKQHPDKIFYPDQTRFYGPRLGVVENINEALVFPTKEGATKEAHVQLRAHMSVWTTGFKNEKWLHDNKEEEVFLPE